MASRHGDCAHLLNPSYKEDVRRWLAEDCPSFDYGGFVVGEAETEAKLLGKSEVCLIKSIHIIYINIPSVCKGSSKANTSPGHHRWSSFRQ